jgi:DNA-binding transcriptional LysR family regulator
MVIVSGSRIMSQKAYDPPTLPPKALILNDLRALEIFVAVVETQGVTKAARRLGLTPSTVSKKLGELEASTGSRLLSRSTRKMSVTDSGVLLYEHSLRIIEEVESAEAAISQEGSSPSGKLKVAAPAVFGVMHVAPHISGFLKSYPNIRLELDLSAQVTDLVKDGTDIAVRIVSSQGMEANMQVIARNIRVLCAAPSYLEARGIPRCRSDLPNHNCLVTNRGMALDHWPLISNGETQRHRLSGSLTSDNSAVLRQIALDGLGIALLGLSVVAGDLKEGRLLEVLPGTVVQESSIVAATAHRRFIPKRVQLFIDHLKSAIGNPPTWELFWPGQTIPGTQSC